MYKSIFNTSLLKNPKQLTKKAIETTSTVNVRLLLIFLSKCPSWNFRASAFFSAYFKNKVSKAIYELANHCNRNDKDFAHLTQLTSF